MHRVSGLSLQASPLLRRLAFAVMLSGGLMQPLPMFAQPAVQPSPPAAPASPAISTPAAPLAEATVPTVILKLPRDLSPWGMFIAADIVVKAVMIGLVSASVIAWTICFAKASELIIAHRRLRALLGTLNEVCSWSEATAQAKNSSAAALFHSVDTELRLSNDAMSAIGVKERIASRLERVEAAAGRKMIRGTGILATIGATAPFVGLFGTVWGIMNSFIGISKVQTTNLAVVAPGIAEALLATALGLVAAIPAVVMYNAFSRWIAGYRGLHADATAAIMRIVGRDLDHNALGRHPA